MKITDISQQKNNSMKINVFVDGTYRFSLDAADAALKGIKCGMVLSEGQLKNLIMDSSYTKARDYAFSILSRKSVTKKLLEDKLKEKGYEDIVISALIDELSSFGYIDDCAYAEMYLEYCREKMWGERKIRYEMSQKGISADIIEKLMADDTKCDNTKKMADVILSKYQGMDMSDMKVKAKITRYFASRGFDFSDIDTAIKMAARERTNE